MSNIKNIIEATLNLLLKLDHQKQLLIRNIENDILCVEIVDLNLAFYLYVRCNRLVIETLRPAGNNFGKVVGKSGMFFSMILSREPQDYLRNGAISFQGNINTIRNYYKFFKALHPDLLFVLNQKCKVPILSGAIQKFFSMNTFYIHHNIGDILTEFFQHEKSPYPPRIEIEKFFDDIQLLKEDFDRLNVKFTRIS